MLWCCFEHVALFVFVQCEQRTCDRVWYDTKVSPLLFYRQHFDFLIFVYKCLKLMLFSH